MSTIYVNMKKASKEQTDKINKILDTKFWKYHAPEQLFNHSSRYGILTIYKGRTAHACTSTPNPVISLQQFFKKYNIKLISFKEIICEN